MITLKNVTLRRGTKVVLDSVNATINPGEHVGLVGRNGAGKSSLFALLNGTLHEDGGDFFIPTQWRMGQVAQHMPETEDSATQFVLDGDTRLMEVQARLHFHQAGVAVQHELGGGVLRLGHVLGHLAHAPLRRDEEVAAVFVQRAVEQGEQRGFAGTVAADQTHVFTGVDGGVDAVEHHFGAAAQGDVFQGDHLQREKKRTRRRGPSCGC